MRRYILLQYMHGQKADDPSSMAGTFDDLQEAQGAAGERLHDINEIIDTDNWTLVWRFSKYGTNF
ncbi:hypothetical protein [Noviherbaspirillum soli]|uniref:hypothetical protein n=1 Tax=Noviherbaspirillum soli TaxID=1064518 RepID=UPI00188D9CC3|nr:hypothetical protein [Noviherbaspirillum soli]